MVRERNWRSLAVFSLALLGPVMVTFLLRPTFVSEYLASVTGGQLLTWETPTLISYLAIKSGWGWLRMIGLLLVPGAGALWWKYGERFPLLAAVEVALFLSLLSAPFAWSYDFVVLLLPLIHLVSRLQRPRLPGAEILITYAALCVIFIVYYYQRVTTPSELYFFWVPVSLGAVFAVVMYRLHVYSSRSLPMAGPVRG